MENSKMKKSPEKRRARALLIYGLLLLVIGICICFVLYRYLYAYENSCPEKLMDELMLSLSEDEWFSYAEKGLTRPVSEFEDAAVIFSDYRTAVLEGQKLSYRTNEISDDEARFTVRCGADDICAVRLVSDNNSFGFSLHGWRLGEINGRCGMNSLSSVAVEIDVPEGMTVFVNGIEVSGKYLCSTEIPAPGMTELEKRFSSPPSCCRYRVDEMFGSISVVPESGLELSPEEFSEEGLLRYVYEIPDEERHSLKITAPEDVAVNIGGAEICSDEAVKVDAGILEGISSFIDGEPRRTCTYVFEGLISNPEVSGRDKTGNVLKPLADASGALFFFSSEDAELRQEVQSAAEEFFSAYVNYSANAYTALYHSELLNKILPGTELYSYVRDSKAAMIWASATAVEYKELRFADFASAGENCFTCTVRYKGDFSATAWYESYSYEMENAYELAFICKDGVWYAAAMSAISA